MSKLYFYETELCCFKSEPKKSFIFFHFILFCHDSVFPNYTQLSWNCPLPECLPRVTTKQGLLNQPWMRVWPWTPGINYSNIILLKSWNFLSGLRANAHVLHRCWMKAVDITTYRWRSWISMNDSRERQDSCLRFFFFFFWTLLKLASPNVWCTH